MPNNAETPVQRAMRQAIQIALSYAEKGEKEFGILLDGETGEELDSAEGDETHVVLNWPQDVRRTVLIMVHNHTNVTPPSHEDWQALATYANLKTIVAVDRQRFYRLDKSETSWLHHYAGPAASRVAEEFLNHFGRALLDDEVALEPEPSDELLYSYVMETNLWMCENYEVELTVEDHEK